MSSVVGSLTSGEGGGGEAGGGEEVEGGLGAGGIAAGDEEGTAAEFADGGGELLERAGAEDDAGGGGEFEGHEEGRRRSGRLGEVSLPDGGELGAGARGGHHGGDGVAPGDVVRRVFVRGGGVGRAVGFDEKEAVGVVGLLEEVELGDAGLLAAGAGVGEGGGDEGVAVFGEDLDVDVDDEHGVELARGF
jgi:hypothetical protein